MLLETTFCDVEWLGKLNVLMPCDAALTSELPSPISFVQEVSTVLSRCNFEPPVKAVFEVSGCDCGPLTA